MGSLKKRVEELERRMELFDKDGILSAGYIYADRINDENPKIKLDKLGKEITQAFKNGNRIEIKVGKAPEATIVEVFENSSPICTINLRSHTARDAAKIIRDISKLNKTISVSFSGICEDIEQEYLKIKNNPLEEAIEYAVNHSMENLTRKINSLKKEADEICKMANSVILEGRIKTDHIKAEKLKTCDSIELKVCRLPTTVIVEVFKNSEPIRTFNLRGLTFAEKLQKIKDISEWHNAITVSFDNMCRDIEHEYLKLVNPRAGYRLKPEIDLATAICTLGEVQMLAGENHPTIKKAKKMGLLDLWFNKVIK